MRWLAVALVLLSGIHIHALLEQKRSAAQIAGLAQEIRDLRSDLERRSGPAVLAGGEHQLLGQMMEQAVSRGLPQGRIETALRAPRAVAPPREEPLAAPEAPSSAQRAAAEQASRIVDAAVSSGTLRRDEVLELRRLFLQTHPAATEELRRRIAVAINLDRLRPADSSAGTP